MRKELKKQMDLIFFGKQMEMFIWEINQTQDD